MTGDFERSDGMAYLQTGSVGPIPRPVLEAHYRRILRFNAGGSPDELVAEAMAVRGKLARLVGAGPDEITLTSSTSDGLIQVLAALNLGPGDEVVTSDVEHAALEAPLVHLATRRGVLVHAVPGLSPAGVAGALNARTRLIAASHVAYAGGARLPVAEVARLAAAHGVPFLVDGAQAAGALPLDLKELGCDFYAFPGYKWLLGPAGTGALYVARRHLEPGGLEPWLGGFAGLTRRDLRTGQCQFAAGAERFERGTMPFHDFACLAGALDYVRDQGDVSARIAELASYLATELARVPGVRVLTPPGSSGLVSFALPVDAVAAVEELRRLDGVIVRSVPPSALRASTHFFNTREEVDRLVRGAARLART
ncbi:MAG: aminotransferase class V-fold PLP-dependent enzyme [bacterium]|nr:aminotransferase class V-fold PLP-dependent enzyme [bacterium]